MRLLITGTRHAGAEHRQVIADELLLVRFAGHHRGQRTLVHGAADGVDSIAAELARGWGWAVEAHPADWRRYGAAAGPLRNGDLVAAGADLVLAFPSTGESKGTWDLIRKAVAAGLRVNVRPLRIEEASLL